MYQSEGKPRLEPPKERPEVKDWTVTIGQVMFTQVNNETADRLARECGGTVAFEINLESGEQERGVNVPKPYGNIRASRGDWMGEGRNGWMIQNNKWIQAMLEDDKEDRL